MGRLAVIPATSCKVTVLQVMVASLSLAQPKIVVALLLTAYTQGCTY